MKTNRWIPLLTMTALMGLGVPLVKAQTTNTNNLTVLGYVDATNNIYFGTLTNNVTGLGKLGHMRVSLLGLIWVVVGW